MTVSADAKYTLIFHTTSTEPGYNIYVSKKNAEIDADATIVLTADRSKKVATITVKMHQAELSAGMIMQPETAVLPNAMPLQGRNWESILNKIQILHKRIKGHE